MTEEKSMIHKYLDKFGVIKQLYDVARLIDPIKKHVLDTVTFSTEAEIFINTSSKCFETWEINKPCDNCISMRAYNEKEVQIKVEILGTKSIMITSIPILADEGEGLVIEFIKDISDMPIVEGETSGNALKDIMRTRNELLVTDSLTKIMNRRFIEEKLPFEWYQSILEEREIILVICDIDNFKRVNDTYGHQVGDDVLREIASILSDGLRKDNDWVARYGGEEFLIFFKSGDVERILEKVEAIRERIESNRFMLKDHQIRCTCSFGFGASYEVNDYKSLLEVIDKRLYHAKKNGKNQIVSNQYAK